MENKNYSLLDNGVVIPILFFLFIILGALIIGTLQEKQNNENTCGESAEFTQLESGQDRFSMHSSNLPDVPIIVDHQTGIIYMRGIGALTDENGKPLRVLEVGE